MPEYEVTIQLVYVIQADDEAQAKDRAADLDHHQPTAYSSNSAEAPPWTSDIQDSTLTITPL